MPERCRSRTPQASENDKVRIGRLAGGQQGRVTRAQLIALGIHNSTVTAWAAAGYLFPELPHVYAVGHPGRTEESDLLAAVLYAGPGAGLCGLTGGLWRGLVKWRTADEIEVSTPRRCLSLPASDPRNRLNRTIAVRERRQPGRRDYHGVPTVPIPRIVLDLAATGDRELVRFVLSQMDFMRILNECELERRCGRGVPGSAVLRQAIARPQPRFARARSWFEVRLIQVCELTGIPLPDVDEKVAGITVDAVWREQMVIVECDGEQNHGTWRQRRRDAASDVKLRRLGFMVIRYTTDQLRNPWATYADLMPVLQERRNRAA